MNYRKSLLAASIITGLCVSGALCAQEADQTTTTATSPTEQARIKAKTLGAVVVTGIRNSEAESLALKKDAASHVEIVTSEDIGKLPAKNVADTLQRLPGVNISSSSASEGGFDESDRVSLRGTSPSMTQTLVNGHTVGTGDWFVLSQVTTVGRSVSYSLLPAEIVSQVVVHKTSEAKIQEGGSSGSVDIITRKPLEFAKQVTGEASIGGVYADLPGNTKPQFSGLFNYKNDANTFGVMVQGFYEKRSLQRDGQELVGGYVKLSGIATPTHVPDAVVTAHPDLEGVYYPQELGATLFTQTRTRKGGSIDIQFKPTDDLTLDLNGFYTKLKADNYNRNYMLWTSQFINQGGLQPGYTVRNNVLTNASFGQVAGNTNPSIVYDQISRPGAASSSGYVTFDADWRATDHLSFKGQVGTTEGKGSSPTQNVLELGAGAGAAASWDIRGTGQPTNWSVGGDNRSPSGIIPSAGWIFGGQGINTKDKEDWFQGDGELDFDDSPLSSLQFGVRYANHTRENLFEIAQGPAGDWTNLANYPTGFANYPGSFGSDLGGSFPANIWYYSPADLAAFDAKFTTRDPITRFYFNDVYKVNEKDSAVYVQANFDGDRWSGNVGVRYVRTNENIGYTSTNPDLSATTSTGPITGSAFGDYYWNIYKHDYGKFLPSANLKFNLSDDLLARVAVSQTMTRPDYSSLAGYVSLNDLTLAGSGGNPHLKPLVSTNFDTSLEWYFAPRGLLSASVYAMQLKDYVNFSNVDKVYKNIQESTNAGQDVFTTYQVSVPSNVNGSVKGVELNYIQPIGKYFGVAANYTFASGHADQNKPLMGTSKTTGNISGFFENDKFNARISYTYRSSFYAGVSRADNFYQAGVGNLAVSAGYHFTDWMAVSFDAMNLNNPKLKYYTRTDTIGTQPYYFYVNGRQYYVNLRFKF
ncbi:MAG TPA: TonB-dependent receptor [Rhodanobacter sp.]|nr:TonB-dependent receptor [Rhodanobacter sp.]